MKDHEINIELLNFLNSAFDGMTFFKVWTETPEVVPADKTHKELLQNYIVSPEIYDYYNKVNLFEPFTKEQKYIYTPILKDRHNSKVTPYNLKICNAYYYRPDFISKLGRILYHKPVFCAGKEIKNLSDLKPYFLEYAKGFNDGYTSFEQKKINFVDPAFTDKGDRLKMIFDFITARPTGKKQYWGELTFQMDSITGNKEISKGYESGLLQGYYYKAWTIVFTQNDFFTPLFKGLEQPQQEATKPEADLLTKIKLHFAFFQKDCPRGHKQILKDEDFENLINWTVLYFQNDLKVPKIDAPIKIVQTNKTYVQGSFKALFNELRPSNTYPTSLFQFYKKAFSPYANDKKRNFDKVRINKEVIKLMNIDH